MIVLYHVQDRNGIWKYSLDNAFCKETYSSREQAMEAAFDALEERRGR